MGLAQGSNNKIIVVTMGFELATFRLWAQSHTPAHNSQNMHITGANTLTSQVSSQVLSGLTPTLLQGRDTPDTKRSSTSHR